MLAGIAKSSWSFNEAEFVKKRIFEVSDAIFPECESYQKPRVWSVCELATNPHKQLMGKGKVFISVDETATPHLWSGLDSVRYRGTFGIKINAWHNHRKRTQRTYPND